MLHFAICDDEKDFTDSLEKLLERYAAERGEQIRITVCHDGIELLERYDPSWDMIFLDIQMGGMDGLEAAKRLRRGDSQVGLIFLTTLAQYALAGYQYRAVDYILKPIKYARLKTELDRWLRHRQTEQGPAVLVTNDTGKYKVPLRELRYVETFNRSILFHTEEENLLCNKSMKEAQQELEGKGFVRCHTSYIVNLYYVQGVKKLEITLTSGEKIPISQPKRKYFMERLAEYWGDQM